MEYSVLFKEQSNYTKGNFICKIFRKAENTKTPFENKSRYPLIFVLSGLLDLNFKLSHLKITAGNFVIFDYEHVNRCRCIKDTIILIYYPPTKLSTFLALNHKALQLSVTSPIPILPSMSQWIDTLLKDFSNSNEDSFILYHNYQLSLAQTILSYPRNMLGEIYAPFYACSRRNCNQCITENKK